MSIRDPSDFLGLVRRELHDFVTPYLWSDDDLYQYMTLAQREFANITRVISDYTTWDAVPIAANEEWFRLAPEIIDIFRARTPDRVLTVSTIEEFSRKYWTDDYGYHKVGVWETKTGAKASHLLLNYSTNEARLYPILTEATTISLNTYRLPFTELTSSIDSFEIPEKYVYELIYYIKYLCYGKQDYETFDGDKRDQNLLLWREITMNIKADLKRRTRRPKSISYGGIRFGRSV